MPRPVTDDLKRAIKLFNRWQFQEANELFEQLAEETAGRDKQALSALATISAGFYRVWHKGGEPNTMVTYLREGIEAIRPFGDEAINLDLRELQANMDACLEEAMRWRRGESDIFNRDLIPRIEIIQDVM